MGGTLRVDLAQLRAAARAQVDVGTNVAGMGTGQSMAGAAGSEAALLSEAACQFAGAMFDAAADTVHAELTAHATRLSAAADQYHRVDEHFASRLRKIAQ